MLAGALPLAVDAFDRELCSSASKSLAGGSFVLLAELEAFDMELFAADLVLTVLGGGNNSLLGAFEARLFESELDPTSLGSALTREPAVARPICDEVAI